MKNAVFLDVAHTALVTDEVLRWLILPTLMMKM
jgi:hypothetical protein